MPAAGTYGFVIGGCDIGLGKTGTDGIVPKNGGVAAVAPAGPAPPFAAKPGTVAVSKLPTEGPGPKPLGIVPKYAAVAPVGRAPPFAAVLAEALPAEVLEKALG